MVPPKITVAGHMMFFNSLAVHLKHCVFMFKLGSKARTCPKRCRCALLALQESSGKLVKQRFYAIKLAMHVIRGMLLKT